MGQLLISMFSICMRFFYLIEFLAIVCSDIAARGLDIENCNLVINYDIAPLAANHVHRSGRTARAGKEGKSVTLITEGNKSYNLMMKELDRKYTRRKMKLD